ncbi:glutamate receptor ionotropic, kainate 2-like [Sitodiplosis mosellana]|uniref:glutamate receptor ionotropic, kainate 2-like n=1 Tax=Sitodiplosis mosellana TaxID=263140 RepID=UPI002444847B|nr:glutamate receptor ionotropic, kainate 2-like [Sitodiplosis mosellana]
MVEHKSKFNELNAMPISDLFIAQRYHNNDTIQWKLFDAYKLNYGYDIEITENGVIEAITNMNGLIVSAANFSYTRRQNLKGINITCGLVMEYPERLTSFDNPSDTHVDVFTKGSINLGRNLRENMNFSCLMHLAKMGWSENDTFDGITSLFQKNQIQMTMHGVIMRSEQLLYAEFAGDIFTPRTPLIFRQPSLSTVANIFVLPLGIDIWICIFILMLVVFVIMMLQLMHHPILKKMSITAFDIATFILGAVCQQGTHLHIPTTSGRFVVLTTFSATLALFTSYSASIVALLQSPSDFISSLDDLIASPLKVGMYEADYARYMVHAKYTGVMDVYDKKVLPQGEKGWIDDPFVGIERVRTELFAFQVDSPSAYRAISETFAESEKCGIKEIQMIVLPTTTILVERNSGYNELIRQRIKWQKEIGLMKRDELRWIPTKPDCKGGLSGFVTVGLNEIKPAVILMLFGYGLSLLVLGVEILFRNMRCKNQKKPNTPFSY